MLTADHVFFSGGGLKVLPFVGVASLLDLQRVKSWTGVSAGGLLALLFSLGCDAAQVVGILEELDIAGFLHENSGLEQFFSGGAVLDRVQVEKRLHASLRQLGVPPGATFRWHRVNCRSCLEIAVVDLDTAEYIFVGGEDSQEVSLVDAVLAGMSLPFLFPPSRLIGRRLVDAAVINNAPLMRPLRRGGSLLALITEERHGISWSQTLLTRVGGRFCGAATRSMLAASASVIEARRRGATIIEVVPVSGAHLLRCGDWDEGLRLGRRLVLYRRFAPELLGLVVTALLMFSVSVERVLLD